jgi:hypothetical protein
MKKISSLLVAAALVAGAAGSAGAQQGFALKGHYLFNETRVNEARESERVPDADGWDLGAEYVLPMGLGLGVTAYTTGDVSSRDYKTHSFGVLAEANYFLDLPIIPITPYAGVHAGLGRYSIDDLGDAEPRIKDNRNELGFQVGARWQLNSLLGVDAQYRRVSQSALEGQDSRLDRNQVLVGITLF